MPLIKLPTLNDDDREILALVKSQRTQRGRIDPEIMMKMIREQQKADVLSSAESQSSSNEIDNEGNSHVINTSINTSRFATNDRALIEIERTLRSQN